MSKNGNKTTVVINMKTLAAGAKKLMEADVKNDRAIEIIAAEIKDDFCLYSFEIKSGKHTGFVHKVTKAPGIIDDELRSAFGQLRVFLAQIDDVYKHSGIEIQDIDTLHNDDLAGLYNVTGFKMQGDVENGSIILIGNKHLAVSARMKLESPKIMIDELSSYTWHNELRAAADKCREEVALYHYGKFTPVQEEEEEDPKQSKMKFDKGAEGEDATTPDLEFEAGKV